MSGITGPNIVTDGLVLYIDIGNVKSYPGSGSTVYDLSGKGNVIGLSTGAGGPDYSSGDGGRLDHTAGNADFLSIANDPSLDIVGDMTIAMWLKMGSATNGTLPIILTKRYNSDYDNPYQLWFEDRAGENSYRVGWSSNPNNFYWAGSDDNFNGVYDKWDYVVGTMSGTAATVYVNAIVGGTVTFANNRETNTYPIRIGGDYTYGSANYNYTGSTSITKIYNKALTAAEVLQNYNAHKSRYGL